MAACVRDDVITPSRRGHDDGDGTMDGRDKPDHDKAGIE
jgi:hypothetical protein